MKQSFFILLSLTVAAAAIVSLHPALSQWAVYDRNAILMGATWRLFTAPLVHFAPSHLVYDAAALTFSGAIIAEQRYRGFGWLCALTPLVTGLGLLTLQPHLNFYGGLSGIATAAVVFLALHGLREKAPWRSICQVLLLITAAKIIFETLCDRFVFVSFPSEFLKPVPLCHFAGAFVATLVFWMQHRAAKMKR